MNAVMPFCTAPIVRPPSLPPTEVWKFCEHRNWDTMNRVCLGCGMSRRDFERGIRREILVKPTGLRNPPCP